MGVWFISRLVTCFPPPRFSVGRATCLVIDFGAQSIRSTPVHDGYNLRRGILRALRSTHRCPSLHPLQPLTLPTLEATH